MSDYGDTGFEREVIERLTRIETKHDEHRITILGRLDKAETNLYQHETRLGEHDRMFTRITTTAGLVAAGVGAAASAAWHWLIGPTGGGKG